MGMNAARSIALRDVHVYSWTRENGSQVRKAREKKGWSVETLCRYTGISNLYQYQKIEKGQMPPSDEQIQNIMFRLGLSPFDVFGAEYEKYVAPAVSADERPFMDAENKQAAIPALSEVKDPGVKTEIHQTPEQGDVQKNTDTIGERLNRARTKSGLTWEQITARSGFTDVTIRSYEKGVRLPSQEAIKSLARCYSLTVYDIVSVREYRNLRKGKRGKASTRSSSKGKAKTAGVLDTSVEPVREPDEQAVEQKASADPVPAGPVEQGLSADIKSSVQKETSSASDESEDALSEEAKEFGRCARKYREKCGLTTFQAADALGISDSHYQGIEDGKKDITLSQMVSMSKLLRMRMDLIASEVFKSRWRVFIPADRLDMYAMIGVCMDHKFMYEIAEDYQSLNIFCNAEDIDSIMKNIRIKGQLY